MNGSKQAITYMHENSPNPVTLIFISLVLQVDSPQWGVLRSGNSSADWPREAVVALIEWLPNLTKTTMPVAIRDYLVQVPSLENISFSKIIQSIIAPKSHKTHLFLFI
jgi:hypothetical protein